MIIGIDPGISGAAAALRIGGIGLSSRFAEVIDLPTLQDGKRRQLDSYALLTWLRSMRPHRIIMENVHSLPREGVVGAFRFGVAIGMIRAVSRLVVRDLELVEPKVWKGYFKLAGGDKEASRELALELFPKTSDILKRKKDHQRAEAMLIAWWASRPPIGRNW
jgi:crossover junction endodeoxyribonuclease RuvC